MAKEGYAEADPDSGYRRSIPAVNMILAAISFWDLFDPYGLLKVFHQLRPTIL